MPQRPQGRIVRNTLADGVRHIVLDIDGQNEAFAFPEAIGQDRMRELITQNLDARAVNPAIRAPGMGSVPTSPEISADTPRGAQFGSGVAMSLSNSLLSLNDLVRKVPGVDPALSALGQTSTPGARFEPRTPTEAGGKVVGDIAQFFMPGGAINKGVQAARGFGLAQSGPRLATGLEFGARVGLEGLSAAGITALQTDDTQKASFDGLVDAALAAVTFPLARGARVLSRKAASSSFKNLSQADLRAGFEVENLFKYNVAGNNMRQTHTKVLNRIEELSGQMTEQLKEFPGARVDPIEILQKSFDDVIAARQRGGPARNFAVRDQLAPAFKAMEENLVMVLDDIAKLSDPAAASGTLNLLDSQQLKRSSGILGAGFSESRDLDKRALSLVAEEFYINMRNAIDEASQGSIRAINQELSDLIPIETATFRQIPSEERERLLQLGDIFALSSPGTLRGKVGMFVANRMVESMRTARAFNFLEPVVERGVPRAGAGLTSVGLQEMEPIQLDLSLRELLNQR